MNKKEIAQIRKQFTQERCTLTRICSCYVDADKNKKYSTMEDFYLYGDVAPLGRLNWIYQNYIPDAE